MSGNLGTDCVQMRRLVGGKYHTVWTENSMKSAQRCEEILGQLYSQISEKLRKPEENYQSIEDYYADVDKVVSQYLANKETQSSQRQDILRKFLEQRSRDKDRVVMSLVRSEFKLTVENLTSKLKSLEDEGAQRQKSVQVEIQGVSQKVDQKYQEVSTQVSSVTSSVTSLEKSMEEGNKKLSDRIIATDTKYNELLVPVSLHTERIEGLKTRIGEISAEIQKNSEKVENNLSKLEESSKKRSEETESTVKRVQVEINSQVEANKSSTEKSIGNLVERIQASEAAAKAQSETFKTTLSDFNSQVESKLKTSQSQVEARVQTSEASIKTQSEALSASLADSNKQVEFKLNSLKSELEGRVQASEASVTSQAQDLAASIANVNSQVETKLNELKSEVQEEIQQASTANDTLNKKIQSNLDEISTRISKSLQESVANSQVEISKTREDLQKEIKSIELSVNSLKKSSEDSSAVLRKEVDSLEKTLREQSEGFASASNDIASISRSASDLEKSLKDASDRIDGNSSKISEHEKSLASLSDSILAESTQRESVLGGYKGELRRIDEELKSQVENIDSELKQVQKQNESAIEQLQTQAGGLSNLDDRFSKISESIRSDLSASNGRIAEIVKRFDGIVIPGPEEIAANLGLDSIKSRLEVLSKSLDSIKTSSADTSQIERQISLRFEDAKKDNERVLSDLHEEIQLVNTRVSNTVNVLEAYTKQLSLLRNEVETKLKAEAERQAAHVRDETEKISSVVMSEIKNSQNSKTSANTKEQEKVVEHLKQSMDAMWSSIGGLSGRIVEMEAHMDRSR